ncbi:MAG: serine hydrolase [Cyclobacteriaceae bacterium]
MIRVFSLYKFALLFLFVFVLSSCQVGRFVVRNFANITDYRIFPSRKLHNDSIKFTFHQASQSRSPKTISTKEQQQVSFEKYLEDNKTVAFLIIRNDSILYEKYFDKYTEESIVASFSMAKSVTSILIGCALDEGLIKSVDEPVTNYVPELKKNGFEKVTLKHLLQMTSGLDFNESYVNPFGDAATYYYGRNLRKSISKMKLKQEPGKSFEYVSGNPQLLGLVLERALKNKTVTEYLQEKLWQPLGMEYDASWSLDKKKNGLEKTFCCINARARDFAKIGRLYLNKGNWNGKQIVSQTWVEESTHPELTEGGVAFYRYQWWLPNNKGDYMAEGILGQFVYVNPSKNMIIVRLGKKYGDADWPNVFMKLAAAY